MAIWTINNFAVNYVHRGIMKSHEDKSVLFALSQIQNPSISNSSETVEAVDKLGTPAVEYDRAKTVEFSAENAFFDLGLFANQVGTVKKEASEISTIEAPMFDVFTIEDASATLTLSETPIDGFVTVNLMNADGALGQAFMQGTPAAAGKFALSDKELTPPTDLVKGDVIMVCYTYAASKGVVVVNSANNFPKAGEFILEVLGTNLCSKKDVHAYIVFPNFKLSATFDWNIQTDGVHPFSGKALQDYCDNEKLLYKIIIPGEN